MHTPYVYAITDTKSIKIGVARKPHTRLKALSTGNAANLTLLGYFEGGFELEKELHNRFKKVRENGEWLHATPDLIEYLNEHIHDKLIVLDNNTIKWFRKIPK